MTSKPPSTGPNSTARNSLGGGGAAALGPDMSAQRPAPIPLAMIGGGFGSAVGITHRDAAAMDGRFELRAGVFSSDHDRCKAFGQTLGLNPERCYATVEAMLTAEAVRPDGIEAAVIVTPNAFHFDAARACLAQGIHVICEKPITTTLDDAKTLRDLARSEDRVLALAHGYSGYAMVHQARALIADGAIGQVVEVQAEYASGWGQELAEGQGKRDAIWRTDPALAGPSTVIGDLGTHAHHLARFVTGLEITEVAAELSTLVEGRSADDNAHVMLRFDNGARGMLWATMAAAGAGNGLRLRVYGRAGHLEWSQEEPEILTLRPIDGPMKIYRRAMPGAPVADALSRRRPGQPEGIVEAFANIYRGVAETITGMEIGGSETGGGRSALIFPNGDDGVAGLAFIEAVVASSRAAGRWTDVSG
jgi:predicted dehydrogenase